MHGQLDDQGSGGFWGGRIYRSYIGAGLGPPLIFNGDERLAA